MPVPDSRNEFAAASAIPPIAIPATDQNLQDWNAYYQLLLTGKLNQYGGEFIVIRDGNVLARGTDPEELRTAIAQQLGVAESTLVIPFVDNQECVVAE